MRNCRIDGAGIFAHVKMRGDTPQHHRDLLVENCTGKCSTFLRVGAFFANDIWPELRNRPIPSRIDRLELRGNRLDCHTKYDCAAAPWFTLGTYIEQDNTVTFKRLGRKDGLPKPPVQPAQQVYRPVAGGTNKLGT